MLNRVAFALRARELRVQSLMFDTRPPGKPLPASDSATEWRAFFGALPRGLEVRDGDRIVDVAQAIRVAESVAMRELSAVDRAMVARVLRRRIKTTTVVCGFEHVLDIAHVLFERGFALARCNAEFEKHARAFVAELGALKYPRDRDAMRFDEWVKKRAFITV